MIRVVGLFPSEFFRKFKMEASSQTQQRRQHEVDQGIHQFGRISIKFSYTLIGMLLVTSFVVLFISIISTVIPYWGTYKTANEYEHFGPFQTCYGDSISRCSRYSDFLAPVFVIIAGGCSILNAFCICGLLIFIVLQIGIKTQKRTSCVRYDASIFLALLFSSIASVFSLLSCVFGGVEFAFNENHNHFSIGICYYLQIAVFFLGLMIIIGCFIHYEEMKMNDFQEFQRRRSQNHLQYDRCDMQISATALSQHSSHTLGDKTSKAMDSRAHHDQFGNNRKSHHPTYLRYCGQTDLSDNKKREKKGFVNEGFLSDAGYRACKDSHDCRSGESDFSHIYKRQKDKENAGLVLDAAVLESNLSPHLRSSMSHSRKRMETHKPDKNQKKIRFAIVNEQTNV